MDTINLNIALKPSKKSEEKLVELTKALSKENDSYSKFIVDGKNLFFHLTLYQTLFPTTSINNIKSEIDKFRKEFKVFSFPTLSIVKDDKSIWLALADSKNLNMIHNLSLSRFTDFRENLIPEKYKIGGERYLAFKKVQQQMIEEYGSPYVKTQRTMPHITLLEFKDNVPDLFINNAINSLNFDFEEITFDKIMLCEAGEHGTCVKILHEVKLFEN